MTIITDAGLQAAIAADNAGLDLVLDRFVVGVWSWEPTEDATELIAPFIELPIRSFSLVTANTQRIQSILADPVLTPLEFDGDTLEINPAAAATKVTGLTLTDASGSPYVVGDDYSVDPVGGRISRNPSGAIASGENVTVSFNAYGVTVAPYAFIFSPDTVNLDFPLVEFPIVRVFNTSSVEYDPDDDFTFDPRSGVVERNPSGAITPDESVLVSYSIQSPIGEVGVLTDDDILFSIFSQDDPAFAVKSASVPSLPIAYRFSIATLPDNIEIELNDPITLTSLDAERLQGVDVSTTTPAALDLLRYDGSAWSPVSLIGDTSGASSGDILSFDGAVFVPDTPQSFDNLEAFDTLLDDRANNPSRLLWVDPATDDIGYVSRWPDERDGWVVSLTSKLFEGIEYQDNGIMVIRSSSNILPVVQDGDDPRLSNVNCTDRFTASQGGYSPSTQFWKVLTPGLGETDVWRSTKEPTGFGSGDAVFYQYNGVSGSTINQIVFNTGIAGQGHGQLKTFRLEDIDGGSVNTIATFTDVPLGTSDDPIVLSFSNHTLAGNFRLWISEIHSLSGDFRDARVELAQLEVFGTGGSTTQAYGVTPNVIRSNVLGGVAVDGSTAYVLVGKRDGLDYYLTIDLDDSGLDLDKSDIALFASSPFPRYPLEILRTNQTVDSYVTTQRFQTTQTFNQSPTDTADGSLVFASNDRIVVINVDNGDEIAYASLTALGEAETLIHDADYNKLWISGRGGAATIDWDSSDPNTLASFATVITDPEWSRSGMVAGVALTSDGLNGGFVVWTQQGNDTVVAYERGALSTKGYDFKLLAPATGPITSDGVGFIWVADESSAVERWELPPFNPNPLNNIEFGGVAVTALAYSNEALAIGLESNQVVLVTPNSLSEISRLPVDLTPNRLVWVSGDLWVFSKDGKIAKIQESY